VHVTKWHCRDTHSREIIVFVPLYKPQFSLPGLAVSIQAVKSLTWSHKNLPWEVTGESTHTPSEVPAFHRWNK